jgi:ABC-type polar amino acid transport system ATPase subunit
MNSVVSPRQVESSAVVRIRAATKRYASGRGVGPVSLDILHGRVWSLLGSNGSGKTTLLRCLAGFESLDSGEISFPEFTARADAPVGELGIVFQNLEPWPHLRVWDNLAVPLRHGLNLDDNEIEKRIERELDRFGIRDRAYAMPFQLSGGIRQRVVLARAFALEPRVLLLDEVTSALDPEWSERVRGIIRDFVCNGGTVISVSHRVNLVRRMSDWVVFLSDGLVVEEGPCDRVFDAPRDPRLVRFLENA